jgi:putative peptidoglycan lipid II flippase
VREKVKKFWYEISQKKLTIPSAAVILGATYLISNILGVVRERLIAAQFGAGHLTDIFYASFKIPDAIYNLLVLGAVSSAFVPIYMDALKKKEREESNFIASNFLNFLLIMTVVTGLVLYVLAWKLVPLLLPGLFRAGISKDIHTLSVAVWSVRIMLISPILFALSAVFGGVLNSHKRFVAYALAPVIYNLSIIFGIIFFAPLTNPPIYGLLGGVLLGAFLHAMIQVIPALRTGFRWKFVIDLRHHELPQIIKLTIPRLMAMGAQQVNILVDTVIASFFVGGITVLTFANNIQTLPTVVFGIAIATAVFPLLAEQKTQGLSDDFKKTFSEAARKILYFTVPASVGLLVLRAQVVRLLYGVGHFGWDSTYWTAKALGFFALGIVAQALIPLLLRSFYALKDTKTPFLVSLVTMTVNIILAVILPFIGVLDLGIAGVALAFSISGFVNMGLLFYLLESKIGKVDKDNKMFSALSKIGLASVIMGIAVHYSLYATVTLFNLETVLGLLSQTAIAIAVGAAIYFGLTYLLRVEETGKVFKRS